jgi:hypothetical protein
MPQNSTPNENKTVEAKCRVDILAENNSSTEGINLGIFFVPIDIIFLSAGRNERSGMQQPVLKKER